MLAGHSVITRALNEGLWKAFRDGKQVGVDDLKIGPHSIDVSLGGKFIQPVGQEMWDPKTFPILDPYEQIYPVVWKDIEADSIVLQPHERILGYVRERFDSSAEVISGSKTIQMPVDPRQFRMGGQNHVDVELESKSYFTQLYDGRSTMGRLFIFSHVTAGYGDLGFKSNFTLEIVNANPDVAVRLHRGMRIGQVSFMEVAVLPDGNGADTGAGPFCYSGSYTEQHDRPVAPVLGRKRFTQPGE